MKKTGDISYQQKYFNDTNIFKDKVFCSKFMGQYPVIFITLKDVEDVIVSNSNLHGYDVKMVIVRPELIYKEVACEIDDNKDRLVCEIANDMLSIAGTYKFELRVEKDGEIVTSSPETFVIKKSIADGLRNN